MTRGARRGLLIGGLVALVMVVAIVATRPSATPQTTRPESVTTPAAAPSSRYLAGTPMALLEEYVQRDFEGQRLERANWLTFKDMVGWTAEPAWDTANVVRGYQLYSGKLSLDKAEAEGDFDTLGQIDLTTFVFTPLPSRRVVSYTLRAEQNHWKLVYPMLRPHVGVAATIDYLKRMAVGYPAKREAITKSIQQLEALPPAAPPSR